ncbi:MAG: DUF3987 domain-containing protein [Rugosibacter sp.]|nr:DUF3987 domain-containing protein [Rugosibacter sp.]
MSAPIEQFHDAIRAAGLIPPDTIEANGKLHRFASNGKRGDDSGWYALHADGIPAGSFGDWRNDLSQTWRADIGRPLTAQENAAHKARIEAMRREREAEEAKRHADAAGRAEAIWRDADDAPSDHPYLVAKGIKPHGLRVYHGELVIGGMACDGALIVPMRIGGVLHSLQFIAPNGDKRFLPGGRTSGCYFAIGNAADIEKHGALVICEGFATAATLRESTGFATLACFSAGNLLSVATSQREKFPAVKIIIAGDFDKSGTGQRAAAEAAQAVSGLVAIPQFTAGELATDKPPSDWNDYARLHGLDAVKAAIAGASAPARGEHRPEPLPALPDVLPFDYAYLPDGLRAYVRDISERMQCPPDFAAVAVFVMMATIIGRKVGMRPMRQNDWTVIVNLWGAVVGNSGVMKSPTIAAGLAPIKQIQAWAFEEFNNRMTEHAAQAELAKLQQAVGKSEAKKKLAKNKAADVAALLKPDAAEDAPVLKRYMTNNASYEALGELLMENPNGLLVESDEIIGLLKQLDAGGQEVARSFYLTAADGDKPYTFDRIMRGKGLHIPALCLSIIGGIQPGVLAAYVRQATDGGAGADGLLQRFGLMVYPDISPDWQEVDRYPDSEAREAVNKLAERLDLLHADDIGAEIDKYGGVPFLRFDDAAQVLFSEWRAKLETRLRSGEEHPAIVSHLSKYRKLIPSLALINHLCDDGRGAVTETALLRAIAFSEYLESHARRIYSYATRPDIDAAKTLLKKLATGKLTAPFKTRDVYIKGWTGLETPAKAQSAIGLLHEYGHLTAKELETGGRATTEFQWIRESAK